MPTNSLAKVVVIKPLKCVTLEEDKYFIWQAQFSSRLREREVPLPKGSLAEKQDQIILSWMLTAISPTILLQVVQSLVHKLIDKGYHDETIEVCYLERG